MYWAVRLGALCFLVFLSLTASADTLTGKVVKITDGDTLYVLDANYEQHKIRLAGIDGRVRVEAGVRWHAIRGDGHFHAK